MRSQRRNYGVLSLALSALFPGCEIKEVDFAPPTTTQASDSSGSSTGGSAGTDGSVSDSATSTGGGSGTSTGGGSPTSTGEDPGTSTGEGSETSGGEEPFSCATPGPNDGDVEVGLRFSTLPDGELGQGWTQGGKGAVIVDGRLCVRSGGCARFDFPPKPYEKITTHLTPLETNWVRVLDGENMIATLGAYGDQIVQFENDEDWVDIAHWTPGESYNLAFELDYPKGMISAKWGDEPWQSLPASSESEPQVGALVFELWEGFPAQEEMLCFDDVFLTVP